MTEDCLFCKMASGAMDVPKLHDDNLVFAIRDINPRAPVHLLIIPEHHVDSFREIGEFSAREAKKMLEFVAGTARDAGLVDYKVQVNVGPGAGQTIFHLHWHVLGQNAHGHEHREDALTAVSEL